MRALEPVSAESGSSRQSPSADGAEADAGRQLSGSLPASHEEGFTSRVWRVDTCIEIQSPSLPPLFFVGLQLPKASFKYRQRKKSQGAQWRLSNSSALEKGVLFLGTMLK